MATVNCSPWKGVAHQRRSLNMSNIKLFKVFAVMTFLTGIVCSDDLDVYNLTARPAYLLLKPGEHGTVKIEFQTSASDISCRFVCDDKGISNSTKPFLQDLNKGQSYCTATFLADESKTLLCKGMVKTTLDVENTKEFDVEFRVGKALKVNDTPAFAWKGRKADLGSIVEPYPDQLSCTFMRREKEFDQTDCNMVIHKAEKVDTGRHNVTICVAAYPSSCRVFKTRSLNVLKKEASNNPLELLISMFGNTKPSELYIVCAIGCPNALPVTKEIGDGKVYFMWHNVTSQKLPVLQIYLSDQTTLIFNDTVREYAEHPDTHADSTTGVILGVVIGCVVAIAIVAMIVIYLKRSKRLCFDEVSSLNDTEDPCLDGLNESTTLNNGLNESTTLNNGLNESTTLNNGGDCEMTSLNKEENGV